MARTPDPDDLTPEDRELLAKLLDEEEAEERRQRVVIPITEARSYGRP